MEFETQFQTIAARVTEPLLFFDSVILQHVIQRGDFREPKTFFEKTEVHVPAETRSEPFTVFLSKGIDRVLFSFRFYLAAFSVLRSLVDVHPWHAHVIGITITEVQLGGGTTAARIHIE